MDAFNKNEQATEDTTNLLKKCRKENIDLHNQCAMEKQKLQFDINSLKKSLTEKERDLQNSKQITDGLVLKLKDVERKSKEFPIR